MYILVVKNVNILTILIFTKYFAISYFELRLIIVFKKLFNKSVVICIFCSIGRRQMHLKPHTDQLPSFLDLSSLTSGHATRILTP